MLAQHLGLFVLNALNQQQMANYTDCMDVLSVVITDDTTMVVPGSMNATQSGQFRKKKNGGVAKPFSQGTKVLHTSFPVNS